MPKPTPPIDPDRFRELHARTTRILQRTDGTIDIPETQVAREKFRASVSRALNMPMPKRLDALERAIGKFDVAVEKASRVSYV